ncbi:MAG TPA: DUF2520 domain-containing protein [Planctomycetota bacterium]|nr:DUF2520 domain-containing protein [Planctomycetota bacterium]
MQGVPTPLAVIGLGSVGRRLALAWRDAGLSVAASSPRAASRDRARAAGLEVRDELARAVEGAKCIVLCVGDASLAQAASELAATLAPGARPACLHTCGSRGASALAALAARGCPVGSLHPLASFAPEGPGPVLDGAWCAIGGDEAARDAAKQLASALGLWPLALKKEEDAALRYHTAATLLANGAVALASMAFELAQQACADPADARAAFQSLLAGSIGSLDQRTPEKALTGPVSRGDVETVRSHLHLLAADPPLLEAYKSLSKRMVELAQRDGRLREAQARAMDRLLNP